MVVPRGRGLVSESVSWSFSFFISSDYFSTGVYYYYYYYYYDYYYCYYHYDYYYCYYYYYYSGLLALLALLAGMMALLPKT